VPALRQSQITAAIARLQERIPFLPMQQAQYPSPLSTQGRVATPGPQHHCYSIQPSPVVAREAYFTFATPGRRRASAVPVLVHSQNSRATQAHSEKSSRNAGVRRFRKMQEHTVQYAAGFAPTAHFAHMVGLPLLEMKPSVLPPV